LLVFLRALRGQPSLWLHLHRQLLLHRPLRLVWLRDNEMNEVLAQQTTLLRPDGIDARNVRD
jgi:hypothetical protein